MYRYHKRLLNVLLPLFLGISSFFLFVGPRMLNPLDISWITAGDLAQQYLGWEMFRLAPWNIQIGANPLFGGNLSNSIVYSDSIPLMALAMKIFSWLLPVSFQYLGLWALICFIAQAFSGYMVAELFSKDVKTRFLISALLVCSPIFLYRMGFHNNLGAHFLILFAFYLTFSNSSYWLKQIYWLILLFVSQLTNFYFFLMIACMWGAFLLDTLINNPNYIFSWKKISSCIFILSINFLLAWSVGYFAPGRSISDGSYGVSRINLLSGLDANGWSYFIGSIPGAFSSYESFSYFGLGGLCIIFFGAILAFSHLKMIRIFIKNYVFCFSILICFTVFSVTNQVEFANWKMHYTAPDFLLFIGSIVRQSSRLFWPVWYALVLGSIALITKFLSHKFTNLFLLFCLLLQLIDTSAGWLRMRSEIENRNVPLFDARLSDDIWKHFASRYKNVMRVPAKAFSYDWETIAAYSLRYKLSTNSVYLARVNGPKLEAMNAQFDYEMMSGQYSPSSLYVIDDEKVLPVLMHLNSSIDLFARINGFNILAPGWKGCGSCPQISPEFEIHGLVPFIKIGHKIHFSRSEHGRNFLVGIGAWPIQGWGWSYPEDFGVWSEGGLAKIVFPVPKGAKTLLLEMRALVNDRHPQQSVRVYIDEKFQKSAILTKDQGNLIDISLSSRTESRDYVVIELQFTDQVRPKDLGLSDDNRALAIGLVSAQFQ